MLATGLVYATGCAVADEPCKLRDPELQGGYVGACKGGWAEGLGEASGIAFYQGGFVNGYKQGRGVKTWPNGDRYEGDFDKDHKQGKGRYTWGRLSVFRGESYEGDYIADRRNGIGMYRWPDGDSYSGPWLDDKPAGMPPPALRNRMRHLQAQYRAVAKPGVKVCQDMRVGIIGVEVLRGKVSAVSGDLLTVAIESAPTGAHTLAGNLAVVGLGLSEPFVDWSPCF
ncbi:MAG: hypothetical protein HGA47_00310 [Zoogloea sp.]|nr:hypothetical protein [Zoogloea sp.]